MAEEDLVFQGFRICSSPLEIRHYVCSPVGDSWVHQVSGFQWWKKWWLFYLCAGRD